MRVRYVAQEPQLDLDRTVRENLLTAMKPIQDLVDRFNAIAGRMADPKPDDDLDKLMDEMGRLQEQIDASGGWELDRMMDIACDALVLPPDDAPVRPAFRRRAAARVALGMALLEKPDLLLLDEPTNHLDAETIQWLEQTLREYPGTVIIVTHDRYFLDNITKWILELENGRGLPFEGNYSSWLEQKAELLRIIEKRETQRQKTLQRELEWIRKSHHGRLQKNEARVKAYEQLASEQIDPDERDDHPDRTGPRLGEKVLQFQDVCEGFRSRRRAAAAAGGLLVQRAARGDCRRDRPQRHGQDHAAADDRRPGAARCRHDRVGPQRGAFLRRSASRRVGRRESVFNEITGGADRIELGDVSVNARAYVARFNFRSSQQQKKVGECSGGERNRIHLAKMLRRGGNLLLLDEPTNDLDVATMRVLEQAMIDFSGCALVISHDRFFLDRICTHLLVMEGDGRVALVRGQFRRLRGGRVGREPRPFRPPPRQVPTADR